MMIHLLVRIVLFLCQNLIKLFLLHSHIIISLHIMSTMPEDYSNSSAMVSLSTYGIKLFSSLPAGSLDLISAAKTECPLTTTSLSC